MRRERALDRQGLWLIAGSVLALISVAGLVAWREARTPQRDPVTLCASEEPILGEVAILLDLTDPLASEETERLVGWLRSFERSELRANDRVSLWVLGPGRGFERVFSRCYPGLVTDPILHNPAMSAALCDTLFSRPLRAAVLDAASARPSPVSPILEAVRELSQQAEFADDSKARKLVVISDLRQHLGPISFYGGAPRFSDFQQSAAMGSVRADLTGVAVEVMYVPRGAVGGTLEPGLAAFWHEYLRACGADPVSLRRL